MPTEILDGSDYFRAPHGSCLRLTYVQDSSAVGSSDGNTDGGLALDKDETSESSSDGEPSASNSDAASRPRDELLEPCPRERSRSRTRRGANHGTKTGIWLAGLAAVHAASAVPASSAAPLSPTACVLLDRAAVEQTDYHLWCATVGFGLLLLVGLLLSAASRRHRLLQEPCGNTASSQAHLDTLRYFVPLLGGPWLPRLPYDLGHLVEPDVDDQEAPAAGIREQVRRVQCLILTFDFTPSVHSVDIPLPTTTEELVQALQPCRPSTHQVHLPSLLPVLPQPQPGMATFVTAPHWHAWGHGVCFDSTFIDNRIYVAFIPEYVDAQQLVHIADLPRQAGIAVWIGPDLQLLPPGHRTHVFRVCLSCSCQKRPNLRCCCR